MTDERLIRALRGLDQPAEPSPVFAEVLFQRLQAEAAPRRRLSRPLILLLAAALLLALAVGMALVASRLLGPQPLGDEVLVFADGADLYLLNADSGKLTLLVAGESPISTPVISPDRRYVGFSEAGALRLVDSQGEALDTPDLPLWPYPCQGAGFAWSPESTRIALIQPQAVEPGFVPAYGTVATLDVVSGSVVSVPTVVAECHAPTWAPSGDRLAFSGYPLDDDCRCDAGVWLSDPAGKRTAPLQGAPGHSYARPWWLPDGRAILYHVGTPAGTGYTLSRLDLATEAEIVIAAIPPDLSVPSPDGHFIAIPDLGLAQIRVIDADGRPVGGVETSPNAQFIAWSPDGTRFAWFNFGYGIFTANADGSDPQLVFAFRSRFEYATDW